MEVSNIMLDNGVVSIYFKHTDYCISADVTFNTYRMYCEFNNVPLNDYQYNVERELIAVNIDTIQWNNTFDELVAF